MTEAVAVIAVIVAEMTETTAADAGKVEQCRVPVSIATVDVAAMAAMTVSVAIGAVVVVATAMTAAAVDEA